MNFDDMPIDESDTNRIASPLAGGIAADISASTSDTQRQQASQAAPAVIPHTDAGQAPVVHVSSPTLKFTEMSGPDTGANAIYLSTISPPLTDADSSVLSKLTLAFFGPAYAGEQLILGSLPLDLTKDASGQLVGAFGAKFAWTLTSVGSFRTFTLTSMTSNYSAPQAADINEFNVLFGSLKYNNTSDNPTQNASFRAFQINATDGTNLTSANAFLGIDLSAVNDPPTFTALSGPVASTTEDVSVGITFQALAALGNEADPDGTVTAFIVKSTNNGTLYIVNSSGILKQYGTGTNDVIDATHSAQWVPDANVNGLLNAINVVARDDGGATSGPTVGATVNVTPVADAPTIALAIEPVHHFTELLGPDTGANAVRLVTTSNPISDPDSANLSKLEIQAAHIAGDTISYRAFPTVPGGYIMPLDGANADGTFLMQAAGFWFLWTFADTGSGNVVVSIQSTNGFGTPAPSSIASYNTLLAGLYFNNTSDAPSTATRTFSFTSFDDGGLASSPSVSSVTVTSVNDPPTFTAFNGPVVASTEDVATTITFANLAAAGNEVDLDGSITAFIVQSVPIGSQLKIVNSAGSLQPWDLVGNAVIDATHPAQWTAAPNANGLLNAFTVIARDDSGAMSATPVQATVNVVSVNDAPVFQNTLVIQYFTEVSGPDTTANALHVVGATDPITDVDSAKISKLQIVLDGVFSGLPGDTFFFRNPGAVGAPQSYNVIPLDKTGSGTLLAELYFDWTITPSGNHNLLTISCPFGAVDISYYNSLLHALYFNNTSDTPPEGFRQFKVSVFDDSGAQSVQTLASSFQFNVQAVNDPPTFTAFNNPFTGVEDTVTSISFADLLAGSHATDPDGLPLKSFVVTGVTRGSLSIQDLSTGYIDLWEPGQYDIIDSGHRALWTPPPNAYGTLNAFEVKAVDVTGLPSATSVQVPVTVAPVNDAPTLTSVGELQVLENRTNPITFADLLAHGDEADVDGTVKSFVVKEISDPGGKLFIGTSLATATPWSASTAGTPGNDVIDATHIAYWQRGFFPDNFSQGFKVVAVDDSGAQSDTPVPVNLRLLPGPSFTTLAAPVAVVNEDTQTLITWENLVIQGDESSNYDSIVPAFAVTKVTSGTLWIRDSSGSAAPWVAGVNDVIDDFHSGYWTPGQDANGVQNAITVVAQGSSGARSDPPVQVQVQVTPVNDRPTLSSIASPLATINEDTSTFITSYMLGPASKAADVEDVTVSAFVVTSVASGTLLIGTLVGWNFVGTPWAAGTNDTLDATRFAMWTPAANSNGLLNAIRVVALDNDGAQSVTPIMVQVGVTPVNDAPTLTSFSGPVDSALPSTVVQVTMAEMVAKGNEADVDGNVASFLVKDVPAAAGTLRIGTTLATAELWAVGSNDVIDSTHSAFWTSAAAATGIQNAFSVVAVDNEGLASATAVSVPVNMLTNATSPTGTAGADTLLGAAGNDTLRGLAGNDLLVGSAGNDVLDGGTGNDTLQGGEGSDVYLFLATDHITAEINDTGVTGIDEVRFATTTTSTLRLYAGDVGIERIVIGTGVGAVANSTGTVAAGVNAATLINAVSILGNAGANQIVGTSFDDTIDGGAGADIMTGGNGNDTYYVDSVLDKVVDSATSGGMDTVYASVSFTLSTNVETLILTGGALNGIGSSSANTITGNGNANVLSGMDGNDTLSGGDGNDTLIGGKGNDVLMGGSGADIFLFDALANASSNNDFVADFESGADKLEFKLTIYKALGVAGALTADQFWSGAGVVAAHDASDRVIYDTTTGTLYYDADGTGSGACVPIAVIGDTTHPVLTTADFLIV